MRRIRIILAFLLACSFGLPSFSQDVSTQGTEFWVSFISNGYKDHPDSGTWLRIQLLISAKDACNCTITNPQTGWQQSFNVAANSTYLLDNIDWNQAYTEMSEYETVMNKGLLITTTDTVSVYCANIATYSFDASFVMPVEGLADDYLIQTSDQSANWLYPDRYTSAFVIVATEDNTTIDITPSVRTLGNHQAGEEFNITLNRGQSYQVRSATESWGDVGFDLSGSRVTARDCKKIAVFNGNNLTNIPANSLNDSDCVFEQAMPIQSWGKKFIVTSSMSRFQDYVKITSAYDNNNVYKNGNRLCTLDSGESYVFSILESDKSCYLEADHSCAVYLYNTSSNGGGQIGAPSMVWIAPIEQRIDEITFSTFNYEHENVNISDHYVNIIVSSSDVQHVYLDNQQISPLEFQAVNGNPNYRFHRRRIEHGVHHLSCANGFNAHVYGFGASRGYAYMVGSKAINLTTTVLINNEIVIPNDTISNCSLEPLTFGAEINYQNYQVLWDFGDGTTSTQIPVTHNYTSHGLFEVTLTVYSEETPCQEANLTITQFYIDTRSEDDVHYFDQACIGQAYSGFGFENVVIHQDTTLIREESSPSNPDCNHFVIVDIAAYHVTDTTINDHICFNGPGVYTEHGFNLYYDSPDTYYDSISVISPHGCDSTIHLVLEVDDYLHFDYPVRQCYNDDNPASYTWINGVTYTQDIETTAILPYGNCDAVYHLDLKFFNNTTQHIYRILEDCNSYDWTISDSTYHCETSGVYSHRDYQEEFDCYLETQLHLTLNHTPHPFIKSSDPDVEWPDHPITATEFAVNRYTYHVEDSISDPETWYLDQCEWRISKESWPIVVSDEDKLSCTVYPMDWVPDTIWLEFKAVNRCDSKLYRYALIPSFYSIEEQEVSNATFDIVPNPSNGEMELHFEHMTGKLNIKVYDIRGILVDQLDYQSGQETTIIPYHLTKQASGLYFFVATSREGTVARKAVIMK